MCRPFASLPPWLRRALQIVVLGALAVLLWRASDGWQAVERLRAADPLWLGAAVLTLTVQTLLSALRWRLTAAQLGIELSPGQALREYYLGQVVNQSLPGGVVGDAGRALRVRAQAGLLASSQSVIFERLAGQLGLLTLLLLGLAMTALAPSALPWPAWLRVPVALAVASIVLAPLALTLALRSLGDRADPLRRGLHTFGHAIFAPRVRTRQIALSLGTALCNVVAFALCARALGIAMPAHVVATLVPLILFAMVLPLSVSGWGLREGAAAVLFPVFGATMSAGLATSIAFGLVLLMAVVPGWALASLGTAIRFSPSSSLKHPAVSDR